MEREMNIYEHFILLLGNFEERETRHTTPSRKGLEKTKT
jgi:hypothetical protein